MASKLVATQDQEWADDWQKIVRIYDAIDEIEVAFDELSDDVSYLRNLTQQQLVINLKKYAWTLQLLIVQKYADA